MSEFKMPSLGADMRDAILIEWFVKPGDQVRRGDVIADLETDKGDIDVEVYEDGIIQELVAKPGDKLPVGAVLARIQSEREEIVKEAFEDRFKKREALTPVKTTTEVLEPAVIELKTNGHRRVKASPLAKKVASALGVDLKKVTGSGEGGVIHKVDVENYHKEAVEKKPVDVEALAEEAKEPASLRMRKAVAAAMSKSNREIPHYYLDMTIDMRNSLQWLERENRVKPVKERILPIALQIKAMAKALVEVPELNGQWCDDHLEVQEPINIGLVISLRQGGIVVPSINNADLKSLEEIMANIMEITERSRSGKLKTSELTSATVTLTSLGDRGVKTVYGVIYPPQVALVGMGKVMERPWVDNDMIGIRPLLEVTLAGDHRATDGHKGARFLEALNNYLQKPQEL